jgi:4-hydroxybenzoate polyprenyltransferase
VGVKAYLRLARLQTAGVTAIAPVIGYLAVRHELYPNYDTLPMPPGPTDAVIPFLLLLGLCAHVFGFVHNEIADRQVDAKAGTRSPKPLPAGEVSLRGAWAIAGAALAGGIAIAALLSSYGGPIVLVLAALSIALAVVYNTKGKEIVGGDAFLAASIAFFVMMGGAALAGIAGALSFSVLGVTGVGALILFFNNAFEGGFKDHVSDKEGGKRTLVLALRARSAKYDSPDGLLVIAQVPVHAAMGLLSLWLVLGPMATGDMLLDWMRAAIVAVLVAGMIRSYNRGIALPDRRAALTMFARHEAFALVLLLLPLLFLIPLLWWVLLFVAPAVVFTGTNKALYGTLGAPDV